MSPTGKNKFIGGAELARRNARKRLRSAGGGVGVGVRVAVAGTCRVGRFMDNDDGGVGDALDRQPSSLYVLDRQPSSLPLVGADIGGRWRGKRGRRGGRGRGIGGGGGGGGSVGGFRGRTKCWSRGRAAAGVVISGGADAGAVKARDKLLPSPLPLLPRSMKPYDRFFACLLSLSTSELSPLSSSSILLDMCRRLSLPMLPIPIPSPPPHLCSASGDASALAASESCFDDARHYYSSRASLVLEEARWALSESLLRLKKGSTRNDLYKHEINNSSNNNNHRTIRYGTGTRTRTKAAGNDNGGGDGRSINLRLVHVEKCDRSRAHVVTFVKAPATATSLAISRTTHEGRRNIVHTHNGDNGGNGGNGGSSDGNKPSPPPHLPPPSPCFDARELRNMRPGCCFLLVPPAAVVGKKGRSNKKRKTKIAGRIDSRNVDEGYCFDDNGNDHIGINDEQVGINEEKQTKEEEEEDDDDDDDYEEEEQQRHEIESSVLAVVLPRPPSLVSSSLSLVTTVDNTKQAVGEEQSSDRCNNKKNTVSLPTKTLLTLLVYRPCWRTLLEKLSCSNLTTSLPFIHKGKEVEEKEGGGGKRRSKAIEQVANEEWVAFPLITLISEYRQFEACVRAPAVPFLADILGKKKPMHIRFVYSDDNDDDAGGGDVDDDDDHNDNGGNDCDQKGERDESEKAACHIAMEESNGKGEDEIGEGKVDESVIDVVNDNDDDDDDDDDDDNGIKQDDGVDPSEDEERGTTRTEHLSNNKEKGEKKEQEENWGGGGGGGGDNDDNDDNEDIETEEEGEVRDGKVAAGNDVDDLVAVNGDGDSGGSPFDGKKSRAVLGHGGNDRQDGDCPFEGPMLLDKKGEIGVVIGNDDDEEENVEENKDDDDDDDEDDFFGDPATMFRLPTLNETQERAATTFLDSSCSSVTLVQGPPGTGKTTFLVSVLCRLLLDPIEESEEESSGLDWRRRRRRRRGDWHRRGHPCGGSGSGRCRRRRRRRVLATAPTNRAVAVLALRFLDALVDRDRINVALIGVEDKLLPSDEDDDDDGDDEEERYTESCGDGKTRSGGSFSSPSSSSSSSSSSTLLPPLRSVFVYTWINAIEEECRSLQEELLRLNDSSINGDGHRGAVLERSTERARSIRQRLERRIPRLYRGGGMGGSIMSAAATQVVERLEDALVAERDGDEMGRIYDVAAASSALAVLGAAVAAVDRPSAIGELLDTADVVFCTLCTAGVAAMRGMAKAVDDLLVDEAAAATEPEICVPFQLGPLRMLAVGDPMQLPATVLSKYALACGLGTSLHERLMFGCGREHIMLDVQYRMKPDISAFPSQQFYGGGLADGNNVRCVRYKEARSFLEGAPYTFLNVKGVEKKTGSGSYYNAEESMAIVRVITMIRAARKCTGNPLAKGAWDSPDRIRIITFYQGQVSFLQRLLRRNGLGGVLVATVDSSQGCEADVVVVSFVRSNERRGGNARHATGFLTDDRRLNVALTRARYQLVCVGDALGTLRLAGGSTMKALVGDAIVRGCVRTSL